MIGLEIGMLGICVRIVRLLGWGGVIVRSVGYVRIRLWMLYVPIAHIFFPFILI